ncbi:lipoprotein localization factor LolB [Mergibacter septicus]|uniref:lipoprotein insertase outer membrane protein LolB n=1 Tax=Mergibacter septicus TaxID=221402 RepID=UPI001C797319|nr:lipoprotein insertase outer membrane protein LolB [Mergibacter septicus]QDJ12521.1 lipoprotein localization factor LolB [Mergibacter septicus]
MCLTPIFHTLLSYSCTLSYRISRYRTAILLITSLILTACSSQISQSIPPTQAKTDKTLAWQKHRQQLENIRAYQVNGQLGYIGKKRFSTHFNWQYHNPENYQLILSIALIGKEIRLIRTQSELTIIDDNGKSYTDRDSHRLIQRVLGFDFPLEAFPDWLKGLPQQTKNYRLTNNGLLDSFDYQLNGQQWKIKYLNYDLFVQPALPKQILIENSEQSLKILLKHWTLQ